MSGYQTTSPSIFDVSSIEEQLQQKVTLLQNSISVPAGGRSGAIYDNANGVTYTAEDVLGGYIVRLNNNNVTDEFPTATELIQALKQKCLGVATFNKSLPNGSSFICKIFNKGGGNLNYYTFNNVYIGGNTPQIRPNATCIAEIIIQDQASLGEGHVDRVFVCMSRCAAYISYND
jgi:hypothetical protein